MEFFLRLGLHAHPFSNKNSLEIYAGNCSIRKKSSAFLFNS